MKTASLFKHVLLIMSGIVIMLIALLLMTMMPFPVQAQSSNPQATPLPGSPCHAYDPKTEDPPFCAPDLRVNPWDAIATMAGYCQADHSLQIFIIANSVGSYLYTVSATQIADGLATAQAARQAVLLADQSARQVWALASGNLLMHDASSGYDFAFSGSTCGLVAGTVHPITPDAQHSSQPSRTPQSTPTAVITPTSTATTSAPVSPAGTTGSAVTTGYLNIRSIPSTRGILVGVVPRGAVIQVIGRQTGSTWDWVKISYNGVTGWVSTVYAGLDNETLSKLPVLAK